MKAVGLTALLSLAVTGCPEAQGQVEGRECSAFKEMFHGRPLKVRVADFANYDLATQYAIFICGNQFRHPPAIYFAEPFAQQGEEAVPFLKDKLFRATDDLTIRDIILVLTEMSRQNTYDVTEDKELVRLMTASVEKMGDEDWKRITQENLSEILENSKVGWVERSGQAGKGSRQGALDVALISLRGVLLSGASAGNAEAHIWHRAASVAG